MLQNFLRIFFHSAILLITKKKYSSRKNYRIIQKEKKRFRHYKKEILKYLLSQKVKLAFFCCSSIVFYFLLIDRKKKTEEQIWRKKVQQIFESYLWFYKQKFWLQWENKIFCPYFPPPQNKKKKFQFYLFEKKGEMTSYEVGTAKKEERFWFNADSAQFSLSNLTAKLMMTRKDNKTVESTRR